MTEEVTAKVAVLNNDQSRLKLDNDKKVTVIGDQHWFYFIFSINLLKTQNYKNHKAVTQLIF